MPTVGIFIDHDSTIRHFIKTQVFRKIEANFDTIFFFPDYRRRVNTKVESLGLGCYQTIPVDSMRAFRMRRFSQVAALNNIRNRVGEDKKAELARYRLILKRNYYFHRIKSLEGIFQIYTKWMRRALGDYEELERAIVKSKIDLIIHPTVLEGLFVNDLIRLGKKYDIPTIYLMNSWDNPSTKALMLGHPDKLLVWGQQTKQHAIQFLQLKESAIVCAGSAQFSVYRQEPEISRDHYRQLVNIGKDVPLICYAGSSRGMNEMKHLEELDRIIDEKRLTFKVLYRPHPWKLPHEAEEEFSSYCFRNIVFDCSSEENYRRLIRGDRPDIDLIDYKYENVVLRSIDALISPLSTMLLEAAILGIPIAAYKPKNSDEGSPRFAIDQDRIALAECYKILAPIICGGIEELPETLIQLGSRINDKNYRKDLKKKSTFFVEAGVDYADVLQGVVEKFLWRDRKNSTINRFSLK